MFEELKAFDTRATSEAGEWLHLRSPAGDLVYNKAGEPLRLRVSGPDGKLRLDAFAAMRRKTDRAIANSPDRTLDPVIARRIQAEALAPTVLGWEGFFDPFSRGNVEEMLLNFHWILEQVDRFGSERANFLPKTGPNSSEPSADE